MWNARLNKAQESEDTGKMAELTQYMMRLQAEKEAARKEQERQAEEVSS